MINLFFNKECKFGPRKVAYNTIKGLQKLGVEYSINKEVFENNAMFHFDSGKYESLKNKNRTIIGPNVWPFNSPLTKDKRYHKMVTPSKWVTDLLVNKLNLSRERILEWPAGIDTDVFNVEKNIKFDCLIYFKRRQPGDLNHIQQILHNNKQSFVALNCGSYTEHQFLDLLSKCRYSVLVNNTESQGIAVQEIMSTNTPMFVWDVHTWLDFPPFIVPATSVPYWSDECGIKTCNAKEIPDLFNKFISSLDSYHPRKYIVDNLSIDKQSKELLDSFN